MAKTKERAFGTMPEWARTGPIDPKNYNYRAEKHCADRSSKRGGEHPVITRASPDFLLWREYFDRHLGGRPWAFNALLDGRITSMTLPEEKPQFFDPSFEPKADWRPAMPERPAEDEEMRKRVGALMRAFADDLRMGKFKEPEATPLRGDGKHAERVAADLEARRRRRELE